MTDRENDLLWKEYFYPNTNVLINNLGIKDLDKLKEAEATISFERLLELRQKPLNMEIDKERLNYIHRYIFRDIYPFAGKYRKVNMMKNRGSFLFIDTPEDIDKELNNLFKDIDEKFNHCTDKISFSDILAKLYTSLIFIHPYREGNGRTIREVLREYSLKYSEKLGLGRLELDWNLIDKEELDECIEVVHLFPSSIKTILMDALVEKDKTKTI